MKKYIYLMVLFTISSATALLAQSPYRQKDMAIMTRWATVVSPTNALKEYPRPQMTRTKWTNLNGLWDYAITLKDAVRPNNADGKILVPFPIESALSGVKKVLQSNQNLWYKRTFVKPNVSSNEHVLLHFGAVDWQATVFVNGKEIGQHTGGYTSFTFDITNQLKNGDNELVVKVYDPTDEGIGPSGKQSLHPQNIYYTASSGIWQTVWLETVTATYIEDLTMTPDLDKSTLFITPKVNTDDRSYTVEVIACLKGRIIKKSVNAVNQQLSLEFTNVHPWSPDDPFLYDLVVRLLYKGKIVDEVKSYFGMRKISIMKDKDGYDRIALNNKPYYNLGTLDQGFWPDGLYTAPTDEALQFDIKAMKAMGFNTIRKHIKVEPARWYYHCDRLGMLVWQDMVNPNQGLLPGAKEEFEKEVKETVNQLRNYPSITTWVLFNEKWGQFDQERLTKELKSWDPTRLVNGHSGEYLYVNKQLRSPSPNAYVNADMTDVHSYPYPMLPVKQPGKAMVCGEFGGIGVPVEGHLWDDLTAGWGYDGVVTPKKMDQQFSAMIDTLVELKKLGLSASIYTQLYDVESEQNGLMTYDRKLSKLPVEIIRNIQAKLNAPTKNWSNTTKWLELHSASDESRTYAERLNDYRKGQRDSAFLRSLTIMAAQKKDTTNQNKFCEEYFSVIKTPLSRNNITFFVKFLTSNRQAVFMFLLSHLKEIQTEMDWSERNQLTYALQKIIYSEEVEKLLDSDLDIEIIDSVLNKYPQLDGEFVMGNCVVFYLRRFAGNNEMKMISPFIKIAREYDKRYQSGNYNTWAWYIFLKSNNKIELEQGLDWIDKLLATSGRDGFSSSFLDTKANLLYKLGRKDEAIQVEQDAVSKNPDNTNFKSTLEKMEKGLPTWPEVESKQ